MSDIDQEYLVEVTSHSAESLEILARALHVKNAELQPTLEAIVAEAVRMLSPARYAGLIVLSQGKLIPRACKGEPPLQLDRLQQVLGDGPCITAARQQSMIGIEDTLGDSRWPEFSAEAAKMGVRSMLCAPLWVDERGLGALSLYADQAAAFGSPHEQVTRLLATFAALALNEAQRADQLQVALTNRDIIGQAKGMLMERFGISSAAAFGYLSRVSQAENIKLAEVARRLTEEAELRGVASTGHD